MTTGTPASLRTILIAEDDPDDREFLSDAFRHAGYVGQLQFAHDGRELLEMLEDAQRNQTPPQLILLDLNTIIAYSSSG